MALTASTVMQLQNSMIDSGANFLVGAATSSFDPNFSQGQAGIMSMVGGAMGVASGAANVVGGAINAAALSANIVAEGINSLSQKLTSYVAECTVKLMSLPMAYVAEVMQAKITEATAQLLSPKEILKVVTVNAEDLMNIELGDAENSKINEMQGKISEKIKKVSYVASQALNKAQEQLNTISTYISKGPDWMNKQVDKYTDLVMAQASGYLGKTVDEFETTKMSFAYGLGEAAANKIVGEKFQKAVKAAKDKLDKIENAKKMAMNKAKAAIAQALMKIKGLLGG